MHEQFFKIYEHFFKSTNIFEIHEHFFQICEHYF
jgi:hypothetical protein